MGRDVEVDVIANDKTNAGLSKAEREFKAAQDRMAKEHARAQKVIEREQVRSQQRVRKEQDKSAKDFLKVAGTIAGSGTKLGVLLGENVAQGLSRAGPAVGPVLVGMVAASAPMIGATMAGAVIGGAAGVGLLGGVLLVAQSPKVKAAYSSLGSTIMNSLGARAQSFMQPVLRGADLIEKRFQESSGSIGAIFQNTSRFVEPLLNGATRGIQRVIESIRGITAIAGPVIDAISQGIADTLNAIADGMDSLADNGAEAGVALRQAFQLVEVTIRGVFMAINALTETYGVLAMLGVFGMDARNAWIAYDAQLKISNGTTAQAVTGQGSLKAAGVATAGAMLALRDATMGAAGSTRDLYGAQTAARQAIADTEKAVDKNGKTLDINTEKGRNNRRALESLATALQAQYDQSVKVNGLGPKTVQVANDNREAFIKLATKLTGSASAARSLANQILGIPTRRKTKIELDHEAALRKAAQVRAQIQRIPRQWRTTVSIAASVTGSGASRSALNAALGKQSLRLDANTYWSARGGDGTARVGGPQPVSVTSTVENIVTLDGKPFYAYTTRAQSEARRAQKWRERTGGKH